MKHVNINKSNTENMPRSSAGGSKIFHWDLTMPGFGVYTNHAGRATFVYQYRLRGGGKPRRITIGTLGQLTVQEARDIARGFAVQVVQGIDPVEARRETERARKKEALKTLSAFVPMFMDIRDSAGKPLDANLTRALLKDVLPRLGSRHMEKIEREEIEQMLIEMRNKSASAARRFIEVLKLVLNQARRSGVIKDVVTDRIPTPKSGRRDRAFNRFELARYLEALHDVGGAHGDALLIVLLLARRLLEVFNIKWQEIDQTTWTWTLPAPRTKSRRPQVLTLPHQVVAIFMRQCPDPKLRTGFVFGNASTDEERRQGIWIEHKIVDAIDANLDRRLELHVRASGAPRPPLEHFNVHDGRTTVATLMQQKPLSIPPEHIEALLHHSRPDGQLKGVYQTYRYVEEVGEALQKWCDHVDTLMQAPDAWPGGRDLPKMDVAERQSRALNLRKDWTEGRTKVAKRSKSTVRRK